MVLRLAFMGTPAFSVPVLEALIQAGHEIVAVYSQPPRASGRRGLFLLPSPVQQAAQNFDIPVLTPTSLREPRLQQDFCDLKLDAAVVVAYGLLLPPAILEAPKWGCYNAHASLLPRWRGAAPIQRAIMAGDGETGMMVMKMEAGLDTGPIALTHRLALADAVTAGQLHDELSHIGADLMVEAMAKLEAGQLPLHPQVGEGVTYAHKISRQETRIDWTRPAVEIERLIRALAPAPAAWCEMEIGGKRERVKILAASFENQDNPQGLSVVCGDGHKLSLIKLQKAGGRPLSAQEFLRGNSISAIL